jgi:DNA (cytosine-5)-methyltransferase 1
MRCLELFAGAGGAALGLERAGLAHAALCEWDRDACATLRAAGFGPVVEGDVRNLGAIAAAVGPDPVDVLWSSFPCQAFSTAGKRLGAADERNGWPWTTAAIDRFRPAWFLGENVRGLLLHTGGCTFAGGQEGLFSRPDPTRCPGCYFERVILPDLRRRFEHVGWWLLDAADYGVPQHRRRVILWAGPRPLTEPAPTHGPGRALPWVSMGEALGLGPGIAEYGRGRSGKMSYESIPLDGPSNAVGCGGPCGVALVTEWVPMMTENSAQKRPLLVDGPSPTLPAQPSGRPWEYRNEAWLAHAPDATKRRRLTTAECAVLQDFPAGHPFQGGVGAQYRQIGNAVPPRLAEVVGRALIEAAR